MRLFSKNSFLTKVLYVEFILLASIGLSFLITAYNQARIIDPLKLKHFRQYDKLFKNYETIHYFLSLPEPIFTPPPPPPLQTVAETPRKSDVRAAADAVTEFVPIPGESQLVTDTRRLLEAEKLLAAKKYSQADRLLADIKKNHDYLRDKKNKLLLLSHYLQNRYREYIDLYTLYPLKHNPRFRLMLLGCLVKAGEKDKAFELFRVLFMKTPMATLTGMIGAAPVNTFLKKLEYEDWLTRFHYLLQTGQYQSFVQEKKNIQAPQLHNLFYAEFLYKQKQYDQAADYLAKIDSPTLEEQKLKVLLKIEIRKKNYTALFPKLGRLKANAKLYAEAVKDAAGILLTQGQIDLSLVFYALYINHLDTFPHLKAKNPDYWQAIWNAGWISWGKKFTHETLNFFKKGLQSPYDSYITSFSYWYHRIKQSGIPAFENYPYSYYFIKTRNPLEKYDVRGDLKPFIGLIDDVQGPVFQQYIKELTDLLHAGLIAESCEFVRWAHNQPMLSFSEKNTLKIIESVLYLRLHNYHQAYFRFTANFDTFQCLRLPRFLCAIYTPLHYRSLIDSYSKAINVDRYLLYSLIREESFYRAHVVSPAKANGLMQILYPTARQTAEDEGFSVEPEELFNPEINIRIGTLFLRQLLNRYQGKYYLALAAYNAGPHRVDTWLKLFPNVAEDEFIEMIPFSETRNYVKNILRNYYYYKFYYGQKEQE